jgi:hypothetical protein
MLPMTTLVNCNSPWPSAGIPDYYTRLEKMKRRPKNLGKRIRTETAFAILTLRWAGKPTPASLVVDELATAHICFEQNKDMLPAAAEDFKIPSFLAMIRSASRTTPEFRAAIVDQRSRSIQPLSITSPFLQPHACASARVAS